MSVTILENASPLLRKYEVVFCDIWGVLHDGRTAYAGANDCLLHFRAGGGRVVLVSNAPLPGEAVARVLDQKGVRRQAWDAIVSSGDLTRLRLAALGVRRVHHIGPRRDLPLFADHAVELVEEDKAEAVVVTGLVDDAHETAADYRPHLSRMFAKGLPLICANPDLSVEVGGRIYPCAGAVAELYEQMGGKVYWEGKPHRAAYDEAFAAAARLGRTVNARQVLAIGDAVRTDLAGAALMGIDALFIAGGLHRDGLMQAETIDPVRLAAALDGNAPTTIAAMPYLRS